MKKTGVTTDCICDLPEDWLKDNRVGVMHFYIHTETGRFRDGEEITSANILEYLESGNHILDLNIPDPREYKLFYERYLQEYEEIIHIATSDMASMSYNNAMESLKLLGENAKRVTIVDSEQLSTGLGHMVQRAVALREDGQGAAEIVEAMEKMKHKVCTSFIVPSAEYMYRMGKSSKLMMHMTLLLRLHPMLTMRRGRITTTALMVGNYERAVARYVRRQLRQSDRIDRKQLYITHAGCPTKILNRIKAEVEALCPFEKVTVTKASAAISSNWGPQTVGVHFVRKA